MAPEIPKVRLPSVGGRSRRMLILLIGLFIGLVVIYNSATVYLHPDEQGVIQIRFGPNKGIQEEIRQPGLHLVIPSYSTMHVFPRDVQVLEMNDDPVQHTEEARTSPAMRIQTSDGATVTADMNVLYRLTDPYQLLTRIGPGRAFEDGLVIPRSERILRRALGELTAEEFYKGPQRIAQASAAREQINEELSEFGIDVVAVLVRRFSYDEAYQSTIEARAIQDQVRLRSQAEATAAIQEAEKNRVNAAGQARVLVERQTGESAIRLIRADADLYYRAKVAEGDLLVQLARARSTELENEALRGAGSENLVGLEMAAALGGAEVIVIPTDGPGGINPLNLESMMDAFDVQ